MTPDEQRQQLLNRGQQLEVQRMIDTSMREAAIIQDGRHRENSQKLDRNARETQALGRDLNDKVDELKLAIAASSGVQRFAAWGIPVAVSVLILAVEFFKK